MRPRVFEKLAQYHIAIKWWVVESVCPFLSSRSLHNSVLPSYTRDSVDICGLSNNRLVFSVSRTTWVKQARVC